jgi:hypothetical protein
MADESVPADLPTRVTVHALELYIAPELERRGAAGVAAPRVEVAQVIFNPGEKPLVRLNDEVVMDLLAKLAVDPAKAGSFSLADVTEIERITLTDRDPNAAHITLLRRGADPDLWLVAFDLRHNAARIEHTAAAANEFLQAARECLGRGHLRAFHENLFAAAELTARSTLLLGPDPGAVTATSHVYTDTRINMAAKEGRAPKPFVAAFNALSRKRTTARYRFEPFMLDPADVQRLLAVVREALEAVEAGMPRRISTTVAGVGRVEVELVDPTQGGPQAEGAKATREPAGSEEQR